MVFKKAQQECGQHGGVGGGADEQVRIGCNCGRAVMYERYKMSDTFHICVRSVVGSMVAWVGEQVHRCGVWRLSFRQTAALFFSSSMVACGGVGGTRHVESLRSL